MQAMKLTLIGVLAVAVAIAGCSDSGVNPLNNPDKADLGRVSLGSLENSEQNQGTSDGAELVKTAVELPASISEAESVRSHMELTVAVLRTGIEGGCWYLKTEKGDNFEPLFEQRAPKLSEGMRLKISGYVDTEISTICQIAPVFRIEKFEILRPAGKASPKREVEIREAKDVVVPYPPNAAGLKNVYPEKKLAISDEADNRITLEGIYGVTEVGCMFLRVTGDATVELNFLQDPDPGLKEGTLIEVIGDYSLLPGSRCQLGPVFNVVYFDII